MTKQEQYEAEIERLNNEYNKAFERLKSQQQEIERLKAVLENEKKQAVREFAESICNELWNIGIDSNGKSFKYSDLTSKDVWRIAKQFGVEVE